MIAGYDRITPYSRISESDEFAVIVLGTDAPYVKTTGTWDECDDYCDRNNSPDNPEYYEVFVRRAAHGS